MGHAPRPFPLSHTHTQARTPGPGVTLVLWLFGRSPSRSAGGLGPERAFPGIPGPRSRVAERAPRAPLFLGSGRSGFFQPPTLLGAKLLLPREAPCRAEAALGLGPRSVHRVAPAAICSEVCDFEIFHLFPGSASRLRGVFPGCTQSSPCDLRDAAGSSPASAWRRLSGDSGSDADTQRRAASSASEPPAWTPDSGHRSWRPRRTLVGGVRGRGSAAPTLVRLSEAWLSLAGP